MKKFLVILLFISNLGFSQQVVTNNLGDFNTIKTYRGLTVELIKSDNNSIEIKGDKAKSVVVKNINGILKISMQVLETFSYNEAIIKVFFKDNLNHLSANEGSKIYSEDLILQDKFDLKATEGAQIELKINAEQLNVKAYTSGNIILEGVTTEQNIKTNTGGIYNAPKLKSEKTTVSVSTGGEATVFSSKKVDANASLGGVITVKGNPKELNKKETLGGYISKK